MLRRHLQVMSKDQLRVEQAVQPLDHGGTLNPRRMISSQPALGMAFRVVFRRVELIRGPDEGAGILQVDLHDHQPRRVAWTVVEGDALE